jgi:hypothetical protein
VSSDVSQIVPHGVNQDVDTTEGIVGLGDDGVTGLRIGEVTDDSYRFATNFLHLRPYHLCPRCVAPCNRNAGKSVLGKETCDGLAEALCRSGSR